MKERIKRAMLGAQLVPGEDEIEIHLDLRLGCYSPDVAVLGSFWQL